MPNAIADDRPIRWGLLGAGWIAEQVAENINLSSGNVIAAVAARDAVRAADFADRFDVAGSYGSYQALVNDPEVDVVYVATTHPSHRALSLLAIEAGKAVLIEKPLCLNARDAREVFAAAATADVFTMEAMWMRTNPLIRKAQELIADGVIGEVAGVRAEFGLGLPFDPGHRLYDLDNGGGALLDVGIYPATFAYLFLGRPDEALTFGTLSPAGADDTVHLQWLYDGVPKAQLWCSASIPAPNAGVVFGTKGWLSFGSPMFRPTSLTVHSGENEYRVEDPIAGQGAGYGPEVEEVERCLRAGLAESPLVTHADTIAVLELLDRSRATLGVKYPSE
ncbi:MAG TPA: Gfo/Idh/MocA family oxidoreductase [Kineosporiaceae bacterium]|nr:Gfo/Idh/MocA family oxidoreductase [Kineosporiaceae bacterium]